MTRRHESRRTPLYRYGALAWFWRLLIALALTAGAALLGFAVHFRSPAFVAMALPLVAPALFFGWVLATAIERREEQLRVSTLLFAVRRIPLDRLGRPRLRLRATAVTHQVDAPRLWVPVRGRLPVYIDLLAGVPDPAAFRAVFPLSPAMSSVLESK